MRLSLALTFAILLRAEPPADVVTFLQTTSDALSADNPRDFLASFAPSIPEYQELSEDVRALLARYDVTSVIEILHDQGDAVNQQLELDWVIITTAKSSINGTKQTRRNLTKCRVLREGKRWKIVSFEPARFFKP